jgi:hypothetical protein
MVRPATISINFLFILFVWFWSLNRARLKALLTGQTKNGQKSFNQIRQMQAGTAINGLKIQIW